MQWYCFWGQDVGVYKYQESFKCRPAVGREVMKHRYQPLKAAVPVRHQHDEADEIEDAHEFPGDSQKLKPTLQT